jgi:hypothetical protein
MVGAREVSSCVITIKFVLKFIFRLPREVMVKKFIVVVRSLDQQPPGNSADILLAPVKKLGMWLADQSTS